MLKSKINSIYELHSKERICQGDILRDFIFRINQPDGTLLEIKFEYIVVISQDCDLQQCSIKKEYINEGKQIIQINQFLPNILFLPAFSATTAREGTHLKDIYGIKQERINSERWGVVTSNNNERYHFLSSNSDYQVPELLMDFKLYFTIGFEYFEKTYAKNYLVTINELFRENLSQRYSYYFNRIGLPDITPIQRSVAQ